MVKGGHFYSVSSFSFCSCFLAYERQKEETFSMAFGKLTTAAELKASFMCAAVFVCAAVMCDSPGLLLIIVSTYPKAKSFCIATVTATK